MRKPKIASKPREKCGGCEYFIENNRCKNDAYLEDDPEGIILEKGKDEEACSLFKYNMVV